MEICFDLLSRYFDPDSEMAKVNLIYELFTTQDLMRKVRILLTANIGALAASKAWTDLTNGEENITLLAYVALQVEARHPGTIPSELLESLSRKIENQSLTTQLFPPLDGEDIEHLDGIEALLNQETDLARLVAYHRVHQLLHQDSISAVDLENTRTAIAKDLQTFQELLEKGGEPR